MTAVSIKVKKLRPDAFLPVRATQFSAGYDIFSVDEYKIFPGKRDAVPTGLSLEIPAGYEGQVRPRSGLSLKQIIIPNSPGTIDADYRGELKVIIWNASKEVLEISRGMRIAQLVIQPVLDVTFEEVERLSSTERGNGGFGSTGK